MFHVKLTLFANTEFAKNNIQQIISRGGPGNLSKKINSQAKLQSGNLCREAGRAGIATANKGFCCPAHQIGMATIGDKE
jgi:hypothetical protein